MNVLITGVSTGLGRSFAEALLQAGHSVIGTVRETALLQQSGPDRGARDVALRQMSSRLEVQRFTEDGDSFCERTGTDAEGAFDNARFTADVLGEVEDGCLPLT